MAQKTITTRLKLKYDTLANWSKVSETFVPLKGEVCFVEVPSNEGDIHNAPSILFKVGDGETAFGSLKWGSGLAADVYNWAKAANKPSYTAAEVGVTEANFPGLNKVGTVTAIKINGETKNPTSGLVELGDFLTSASIEGKQDKAISLTDITAKTVEGALSEINALAATKQTAEQVNSLISTELAKHKGIDKEGTVTSVALASGTNNGTLKLTVDGKAVDNIAVKGLGSAAFTDVADYATAAQGTLAANALPKADFETFKTSNNSAIADAKKAGTDAVDALSAYQKTNDAAVSKNATDISNLQTTLKSGVTFKGKVEKLPATTDYSNGDLIIVGTKEYICYEEDDTKSWIELGDEGSHLTKATADTYYVPLGRTIAGVDLKDNVTKAELLSALNVVDGATKVTESTVSGWGFTKNAGTLTGVTMNGKAVTVSAGVADLGTVITAHQDISGKADKEHNHVISDITGLQSALDNKQASLTEAQLNAVNSGITAAKVTTYDGYSAKITALENKEGLDKTGTVTSVTIKGSTYVSVDNENAITTSGVRNISLSDKVLTSDDTLIFDCGSSTVNI